MRDGRGNVEGEEMSSSSVVCGTAVLVLVTRDQEVGQTHFVPGFSDPQKRKLEEVTSRLVTTKWKGKDKTKAECVESGLDGTSQPHSTTSSGIKL